MLSRIMSNLPRWLAPALVAAGLAACGGGGGGGGMSGGPSSGPQGCTASTCGNALLTLTDLAGDFASYQVGVTSLTLTKADGTVVETLPVATTLDFTQLVNVTELVSAGSIPQGEYVAATMTLDYSKASIYVYPTDTSTTPVQVAQVQDSKTPPTILWSSNSATKTSPTITVAVKLDAAHHFFVSPGKLSRLAIDFNVAQSNQVDLKTNPGSPIVTVLPFIVADVDPADTKDIRVRGTLAGVNAGAGSYTVNVEPFDDDSKDRGQVTVLTTAQTTFEVDGNTLNQADGLKALQGEPLGTTMTVAFGTLSKTDHTFTAARVLAGSSVQSASLDRLQGVVIKRSTINNVITLAVRAGRMWVHPLDADQFTAQDVALTIGAGTAITAAGAEPGTAPALAWPSVGSKITAFGKSGTDAGGHPTFDATSGRVRLELTSLWGSSVMNGVGTGQVTLNVAAIEGQPASAFDFTGTGGKATGQHDSDPHNYVIATGVLPLAMVTGPSPLRFFGLVQPFGYAQPDFNTRTLVSYADTSALLEADYGSGASGALTAGTNSFALVKSALPTGTQHFVRIGPQLIDLTTLSGNLTLTATTTAAGPFAIRTEAAPGTLSPDMITLYSSFADFYTALAGKLTATILRVTALGQFDQTTNTFTADQIDVSLH
jgi:hypothetical protein